MRETSVVVLNNEDDVKSVLPVAGRRRSLQATTDFEACNKSAGLVPKEMDADSEG